jgi:hypothetical protein
MRVDQLEALRTRQGKFLDRREQDVRHRMACYVAPRLTLKRVAPPLQPQLARHRFVHEFADTRDLVVEGVEREEMLALGRRHE